MKLIIFLTTLIFISFSFKNDGMKETVFSDQKLTASADFALFFENKTGLTDIRLNGPASNNVDYAPAYGCSSIPSEKVGGPFKWDTYPPNTALYAFSNQGECGTDTNIVSFMLKSTFRQNTQCSDSGFENWRIFTPPTGNKVCLFWNNTSPYELLILNGIDEPSGLLYIKLAPNKPE